MYLNETIQPETDLLFKRLNIDVSKRTRELAGEYFRRIQSQLPKTNCVGLIEVACCELACETNRNEFIPFERKQGVKLAGGIMKEYQKLYVIIKNTLNVVIPEVTPESLGNYFGSTFLIPSVKQLLNEFKINYGKILSEQDKINMKWDGVEFISVAFYLIMYNTGINIDKNKIISIAKITLKRFKDIHSLMSQYCKSFLYDYNKKYFKKKGRRTSQINSNVEIHNNKKRKSIGAYEINSVIITPLKNNIKNEDKPNILCIDEDIEKKNIEVNNDVLDESSSHPLEVVDNNKLFNQDVSLIPKKRKYINGINSAVTSGDFYNSKKWQDYCNWKNNVLKGLKV
ncbi:hypothetical protein BCR32DRAFT_272090 [Anaeromyces robustus]|uniref:ORC6 second cyclin-like domain-containing protein n=1 Tax=Anaeromyces robustus TaxID=1754192 RepID=A0A1Y1WNJ2_9FUNG|nr:hypothetical protein BCR32DRAFT_272090 [Anaeromyces robustus]|eukprot:ORX75129.1 hypothetical protein BCR32DRAFT_272090 [Anaeromyces robustus]